MDYTNPNDFWTHPDFDEYKGLSDEERLKAGCFQLVSFAVMIAVGLLLCALLGSCKSVEYVTVPEVHNEHHWHTDSIHQTDSVIRETQTTIMQLDSAAMAKYGITLKNAERAWLVKTAELERQIQQLMQLSQQKDSVHDTIPQPYPVIKEVPAELNWWQRLKMRAGGLAILLCLLAFLIWVWRTK